MTESLFRSVLARNTGWMFLGSAIRLLIQATYFTVMARSLGAYNFGAFVGVVALVGIVYPFGNIGSGTLIVKNVSRHQDLFPRYWGSAIRTTVLTCSLLFVVVLLLSPYLLPSHIPLRLVMLISLADLFGMNFIWICGQAFQAFERLHWMAVINVLLSGSRLVGAVALNQFQHHPSALDWGYLYFCSAMGVVTVALLLVSVRLGLPDFGWKHSAAELREGFYFSAGLSAQTVYNDLDKTMLARLGSLDATGIYGAAYRIIDASFVPVSAVLAAAYPKFFRIGADGVAAGIRYAKRLLLRAMGYSVLAGAGLFLCADILPYVIGPEYTRTVEALRWLSVLPILKSLHYFFADALSGAGYQGLRTVLQASVAVFNGLINLWLIPAYSWRGAAWASIASDALLAAAIGTAVFVLSRQSRTSFVDSRATASYD